MKAVRTGLRLDTRDAQVQLFPERPGLQGWQPLRVRIIHGPAFCGWWSRDQEFVRTVVCDPRQLAPIQLRVPGAQTSIHLGEQPILVAR